MENRRFSRVSFAGKAHLDISGQRYDTEVLDLSLKGALIRKPAEWPQQLPLQLDLHISLDEFPLELSMLVSIAHQTGTLIGLHCEKIDIDSVSHLRRLLELNLGDADLLSRELTELGEQD